MRKAVRMFAERMEEALKANEFRGTWKGRNPEGELVKLWDNLYDLDDQMEKFFEGEGDLERILTESVNVANYAMILADICLASRDDRP